MHRYLRDEYVESRTVLVVTSK